VAEESLMQDSTAEAWDEYDDYVDTTGEHAAYII